MLIVFAIPIIVAVALVHRLIQAVAPSNLLVRSVRSARPRWRLAAALLGIAVVLFVTMHVVAKAVSAGAPGWLNLVVLVLAWDALKVGGSPSVSSSGASRGVARQSVGRASQVPQPTS